MDDSGNKISGITKQETKVDKPYGSERNEGLSLLDVESPKPNRSETLQTFMKHKGLNDDHVLYEDDDVISFAPKDNLYFDHMFDYDKKKDVYDFINSAKFENDRVNKLHDYYNKRLADNPGKDLYELLDEDKGNYIDGIRKRSRGKIGDFKAYDILDSKFGKGKDIEGFLRYVYNKDK